MSEFVKVCCVDDIAVGDAISAEHRRRRRSPSCTPRTATFYAIYDECSHAAVPLSEGEVDGCTLECWLHGSRFDLRTGEPTGLPATVPVPVYPVEIRDGFVFVSVTDQRAPTCTNGVDEVSKLEIRDLQVSVKLPDGELEADPATA